MLRCNVRTSAIVSVRESATRTILSLALALAVALGLTGPAAAQETEAETPELRVALVSVPDRAPEASITPPDTAREGVSEGPEEDPDDDPDEDPELEVLLERVAALEAQVRAATDAARQLREQVRELRAERSDEPVRTASAGAADRATSAGEALVPTDAIPTPAASSGAVSGDGAVEDPIFAATREELERALGQVASAGSDGGSAADAMRGGPGGSLLDRIADRVSEKLGLADEDAESAEPVMVDYEPYDKPARKNVGGHSTAAALMPDKVQEGTQPGFQTPFGLNLTVTGHVKMDVMAADASPELIQGDFPVVALPKGSTGLFTGQDVGANFFSAGFRESRLTFLATGPEFLGAQTSALFTIDGYGFGNAGNGGDSDIFSLGNDGAGPPRFHMGWIDLAWENVLVRAGNQLTLYGNHLYDGSLNVDFNRGNWYLNTSGVMASANLLGVAGVEGYTLDLAGGIYRSPSSIFGLGGLVNFGELSGTPMIQGRLRFSTDKLGTLPIAAAGFTGFFDRPASIEVAGVYAEQDFNDAPPTGQFESKGIEVRGTLPLNTGKNDEDRTGLVGLTGQWYTGENLCQGFETGLSCLVQQGDRVTEAEGWGAMGQLKVFATNDLSFYTRFGSTEVDKHDGVVLGIPIAGGLRRTESIVGGFWYQPSFAPNLLLGAAWKNYQDTFQNGQQGRLNYVRPQIYFRF